jgi:hypothetical protein
MHAKTVCLAVENERGIGTSIYVSVLDSPLGATIPSFTVAYFAIIL